MSEMFEVFLSANGGYWANAFECQCEAAWFRFAMMEILNEGRLVGIPL